MTLSAQIASLVAAAVGRDLIPPDKSITRTLGKQLLNLLRRPARWQDEKALDGPDAPYTPAPAPKPKPKPKPAGPFAMYDAVTVENIPHEAVAVAGYVNGAYVTAGELRGRFPHARLLTIAVNIGADADCLDVETGDATPAQAPEWVKRQIGAGMKRPCVYANRSTMPEVWAALHAAGLERDDVRLWVADWAPEPHIPEGYDACQWYGGITAPYDESLCLGSFFNS